jgi:hypothetical protein
MRRARWFMLVAGVVVGVAAGVWAGDAKDTGENSAGRYTVPQGGVAELVRFIQELSQFRPGTVQEDLEHRAKFRPALQQAAERIVKLEKDRKSEAYRAAEFILLANRVRWIARALPQEQRKTLAEVKTYLAGHLDTDQAEAAADLAMTAAQAIQNAGQPDLAAETFKTFAAVLEKVQEAKCREMAASMGERARELLAVSAQFPAPGAKIQLSPKGRLVLLDLKAKSNQQINDLTGTDPFVGNGLAELPRGEQVLGGVRFRIGDTIIRLASTNLTTAPKQVEGIPVDRKVARLYLLHSNQWGSPDSAPDGTKIGQYEVHYEDGSSASIPIVYGQDVRDWWNFDGGRPVTRGRVVWTGSNRASELEQYRTTLRLYLGVWENPHPENKVTGIDFVSENTICAPFCVAITVEEPEDAK